MSKYEMRCERQAQFFGSICLSLLRGHSDDLREVAIVAAHFARLAKQPTMADIKEKARREARLRNKPYPRKPGPKPKPNRPWKFQHD